MDELGRADEALQILRQGIQIGEETVAKGTPEWGMVGNLGECLNSTGIIYWKRGELGPCVRDLTRKRELEEMRAEAMPAILYWQSGLGIALNNEGELLNRIGRSAEALERNRRSLEVRRRIHDRDPKDVYGQDDLSSSYSNIGDTLTWMGRLSEASESYDKAINLEEAVIKQDPKTSYWRYKLAAYVGFRGDVAWWSGQTEQALEYHQRARELRESVVEDQPGDVESLQLLAETLCRLDRLLEAVGRTDESQSLRRQAFDQLEKLYQENSENLFIKVAFAVSLARQGRDQSQSGNAVNAVATVKEAIGLVNPDTEYIDFQYTLGTFHALLSQVGRNPASGMTPEQAETEAKTAVEILKKAAESGYRPLPRYQTDPDLDSLHERDDFKQLLQWLESAVAATPAEESPPIPQP